MKLSIDYNATLDRISVIVSGGGNNDMGSSAFCVYQPTVEEMEQLRASLMAGLDDVQDAIAMRYPRTDHAPLPFSGV